MGTKQQPDAAPSDEELGAALRKISITKGTEPSSFTWYAKLIVRWADDEAMLARFAASKIQRVKVLVNPPGYMDGAFEMLCEMISGERPVSCVNAFPPSDLFGDALVIAVERIEADAIRRGMTDTDDAKNTWDRILRGQE